MKKEKITGKGLFVGIVVWVVLVVLMATEMFCLKEKSCGVDDFFMYAIICIGFIAPAYFIATLFSDS